MDLINILALYIAIKNTAKRYHWKSVGQQYYADHLLFDKVYESVDDDLIDTIVEQYYMGVGRNNIDMLDNLTSLALQYEGQKFSSTDENMKPMFEELANMMNKFLTGIQKLNSIRGINAELDNIASNITQAYSLVLVRLK